MAGRVPGNASSLYARNLYAFLEPMIDRKEGKLAIKWDDEIVAGTLIAKDGHIVHPRLKGGAA
jgi:NAD(P) transhydrogenase subunit alpha